MRRAIILTLAGISLVGVCYISSKTNISVETPYGRFMSREFFLIKHAYADEMPLTQPVDETWDAGTDDDKIRRLAEHVRSENTAYRDGTERYLIHVAPTSRELCWHWVSSGSLKPENCLEHPNGNPPAKHLDYNTTEEICIDDSKHRIDPFCFSIYDITER